MALKYVWRHLGLMAAVGGLLLGGPAAAGDGCESGEGAEAPECGASHPDDPGESPSAEQQDDGTDQPILEQAEEVERLGSSRPGAAGSDGTDVSSIPPETAPSATPDEETGDGG